VAITVLLGCFRCTRGLPAYYQALRETLRLACQDYSLRSSVGRHRSDRDPVGTDKEAESTLGCSDFEVSRKFAQTARLIGSQKLNQHEFDNLLKWLNPNRELAANKYREIHEGLIKLFSMRGYFDAEDLADDAVNRVMMKAKGFTEAYVGDPALYFYGVAKNILRECERRQPNQPLSPNLRVTEQPSTEEEQPSDAALLRQCLKKCLRSLDRNDKDVVLSYYHENKRAKIDFRKVIAERLGIETNALRVRVYRLRSTIKQCVEDCLKKKKG
jgi:RNA polymerase sigma factor (sigma-70 family)